MSEMKPTPGEWICGDWMPSEHNTAGWVEVWAVDAEGSRSLPFIACKHIDQHGNARLIAEAGTVHHETGLTPRQLVERVKELEEAATGYRDAQEALDNHEYMGINAESYSVLRRRCNAARSDLDAALSKSLPNTVAETPK